MARDSTYDLYKKNKSSRLKALRRLSAWLALAGLERGTRLLSLRGNQRLGRLIGSLAYHTATKDRGIARYQLEFALPQLDPAEREGVVKASFMGAGQTLFETLQIQKFRQDPKRWIKLVDPEAVHQALEAKKGCILLFGHMGNWELMSIVYEMLQVQGFAIEAPLDEEKLDQILTKKRASPSLTLIRRGEQATARQLLQCFRSNGALLFGIDQDTRVQSVFVDFFGKPAATPKGAASMAQKFGAPVLTSFDRRHPDGTHSVHFKLLSEGPYQKSEEELVRLTQIYSQAVEEHIRQDPSQWMWFHRRWKTQPDELLPDQAEDNPPGEEA